MTIAFDAVSTDEVDTGSASVSHTASGTNRYAVAVITGIRNTNTAFTFDGVDYGASAMTYVNGEGGEATNSRYIRTEIYILADPPTSAQTVTLSYSVALLTNAIAVMTFTGVDTHSAHNADYAASGTTANAWVTTTVANAWLVGGGSAHEQASSPSATPGTGITERYDVEMAGSDTDDDFTHFGGHKTVASAGASNFDWTITTGNDWIVAALELQPAAVGGDVGNEEIIFVGEGIEVY